MVSEGKDRAPRAEFGRARVTSEPISGAPPLVSAVICTRNRSAYLRKSLGSLLRQSRPGAYEVLVVDNASGDDTASYLRSVDAGATPLRLLFEPQPGLSRARNVALRDARGALIAFLDDDAIAQHDWIERIAAAFAAGGDAMAVLTGRIDPIWEAERPDWVSREALGALAIVDWGADPDWLAAGQYVVGANMAFRTDLLREVGGFPEQLGRVGAGLLSGEETFVTERLAQRGRAAFYDPRVVVRHHVQAERLERGWLVRRAYHQGVSNARADFVAPALTQLGRCGAIVLRLPACLARAIRATLECDSARRFDERLYASRALGEISGRLRRVLRGEAAP